MAMDNAYEKIKAALEGINSQIDGGSPDTSAILGLSAAARAAVENDMNEINKAKSDALFRALKSIDPFLRVVPNEPTNFDLLKNRVKECSVMLDRMYESDEAMKYVICPEE